MGRQTKLTPDEVLKHATNLFWKEGAGAVSTRDLEKTLDLRAPAIYRRFKSKDEFLARCLEFYIDHVVVMRIQRFLEAADDPLQGLHDFFTTTLVVHGREGRSRGCLMATTAAHSESQIPEVHAALERGWRLTLDAFRRQIERAQRAGQVDATLDAGEVSQALLMSLIGLLTLVRVGVADLRPAIDATLRLYGWRPKA